MRTSAVFVVSRQEDKSFGNWNSGDGRMRIQSAHASTTRQRIATEFAVGEDIDGDEIKLHVCIFPAVPGDAT